MEAFRDGPRDWGIANVRLQKTCAAADMMAERRRRVGGKLQRTIGGDLNVDSAAEMPTSAAGGIDMRPLARPRRVTTHKRPDATEGTT